MLPDVALALHADCTRNGTPAGMPAHTRAHLHHGTSHGNGLAFMANAECGHRAVQASLTGLGWLTAHVWRHLRLWQIQASQKSQMAPTSAMPVAFFPPCGTQQSLPRHLQCRMCLSRCHFSGLARYHAVLHRRRKIWSVFLKRYAGSAVGQKVM